MFREQNDSQEINSQDPKELFGVQIKEQLKYQELLKKRKKKEGSEVRADKLKFVQLNLEQKEGR